MMRTIPFPPQPVTDQAPLSVHYDRVGSGADLVTVTEEGGCKRGRAVVMMRLQ